MAQYYLGHLYEKGLGVERDAVKAIQWYNKAAQNELADAECALGQLYCEGAPDCQKTMPKP